MFFKEEKLVLIINDLRRFMSENLLLLFQERFTIKTTFGFIWIPYHTHYTPFGVLLFV